MIGRLHILVTHSTYNLLQGYHILLSGLNHFPLHLFKIVPNSNKIPNDKQKKVNKILEQSKFMGS